MKLLTGNAKIKKKENMDKNFIYPKKNMFYVHFRKNVVHQCEEMYWISFGGNWKIKPVFFPLFLGIRLADKLKNI